MLESLRYPINGDYLCRKCKSIKRELLSGEHIIYTEVRIDHIYLFSSVEEFLELAKRVGFVVKDYKYATEVDNISYEEALNRRCTILLAVHLQHK